MGKSKQREKDVLGRLKWSKRHASSKFQNLPLSILYTLKEIRENKRVKKAQDSRWVYWEREREEGRGSGESFIACSVKNTVQSVLQNIRSKSQSNIGGSIYMQERLTG
jgi:hypothetical protein